MTKSRANQKCTEWWVIPVAHFIWLIITVISFTLRIKVHLPNLVKSKDVCHCQSIYAIWHNRTFVAPYIYKYILKIKTKVCLITSASKHGALVERIMANYGQLSVRGSSHRRGLAAFRELLASTALGNSVCIATDGSRGPRYKCKPGAVKLASMTGLPIVPLSIGFAKYWQINTTWDKYIIPKPFSRVDYNWGDPIYIPADISNEDEARYCLELDQSLALGIPDFKPFNTHQKNIKYESTNN